MKIIKKIYHGFIFLLTLFIFFLSIPIAYIIYGKKRYWLISEVDFDARDNGIYLFEYLVKHHPEINSIYLISEKNPNYEYVKSIGEIVEPYSYKHMLIFIAAQAKISTLVHGCSPSEYITKFLLKFHFTGKNICLNHGVNKDFYPNYLKKNAHLDMICCGGKPEFEFTDNEYGYKKGVAKYTGSARFDNLHNLELKKELFIMPTWRRWLDSIKDLKEFENSDYYQNWLGLLKDEEFLNISKKNNLDIYFYVHPKLNKYLDSFKDIEDIKFLNSKNGDSVQEHLKQSLIMITDYSSVFFDFAYMKKPVIYYQFDEDKYRKLHYQKAYFDYRDNGFGRVCINKNEAIDNLKEIIDNNYNIDDVYLKRVNDFFPLYDQKNCERIYEGIIEVLGK